MIRGIQNRTEQNKLAHIMCSLTKNILITMYRFPIQQPNWYLYCTMQSNSGQIKQYNLFQIIIFCMFALGTLS